MASEEALLVEYEIAHNEVERLNNHVWTTAQILVPLSLAAVGLLLNLSNHTIETLTTVCFAALASILILWGWYTVARRWLTYQSIAQYRIRQIERELDLWCCRYELYAADKSRGVDLLHKPGSLSDAERSRYEAISLELIPKGSPTTVVIRNIVLLMVTVWALLIIREGALCAGVL